MHSIIKRQSSSSSPYLTFTSMASLVQLVIFFSFFISISLSHAQQSPKPKALLLPVSKDPSTLQYITHLNVGTPFVKKNLVVDLGGRYSWLDCDNYNSSTYKPSQCGSAPCSLANTDICRGMCIPERTGCNNNTCLVYPENTVTGYGSLEELFIDTISLQSTDGSKSGPPVKISKFMFSCAIESFTDGLANGVKGMIGLGRNHIGLPMQLSSSFGGSFRRKFAICLPSTNKSNGVIFVGDSPYVFYPRYNTSKAIDVSSRFTYTRLYINPVPTAITLAEGESSTEYFVGVTSMMVNKKPISINSTLLSFDKKGYGGTKISTVNPYTVLESSIYKSLVKMFDKEIARWNVTKVAPVAPFKECYTIGNIGMTLLGIGVPDIAFVFENKNVYWELYGANSMVEINRDVVCLAFIDGGLNPRTSIVIGAHQLQDNLLQFDLASSRLAFTSTLLFEEVECSNFKF